jgi:hypothetical protein
MLQNKLYKQLEFIFLYAVLPALFALDILSVKFLLVALWLMIFYAVFILKVTKCKFSLKLFDKSQLKSLLLRFFLLAIVFLFASYLYTPEAFFHMAKNETKLFIFLLIFYPLVSVLPQELLYRVFFFSRYSFKLSKQKQSVFNAVLFSFAHTLFGSSLVLILTFIGGLIFSQTYLKNRSFLLVCIEHILYGYLLFVSGIGELFLQKGTLDTIRTFF